MIGWLNNFLKKNKDDYYDIYSNERRRVNFYEILNASLALAMEFGPNLNKPINSRLKKVFPELSRRERNGYNKICQDIVSFGRDYMFDHFYNMKTEKDFELMKVKFTEDIRLRNNWINEENIRMLFNQACYYASK